MNTILNKIEVYALDDPVPDRVTTLPNLRLGVFRFLRSEVKWSYGNKVHTAKNIGFVILDQK